MFLVRKLRKEKWDLAEKVTDHDADENSVLTINYAEFYSLKTCRKKTFCVTYV